MRTPVTLKIKFKSANLDQFIERYSVDVSRGGIFIRTKEPLPVGTQLKFEFQLSDAQPLISGEGTVVWIREHDPTRTGVAPGMGVRFDKLAPQSQQVLDKILTEKQRLDSGGFEGKFDAATRAVSAEQAAKGEVSGAIDNRARPSSRLQSDRTPLPDPSPFGGESRPGDDLGGFGSHESTRVMLSDQAEALAQKMKEHEEANKRPTPLTPSTAPKPMAAPRMVAKPTPAPANRPGSLSAMTKQPLPRPGSKPPASVPAAAEQPPAAAASGGGGLTVTLGAPPPKQEEPQAAAPVQEQPRQPTQPYAAALADDPAAQPVEVRAAPEPTPEPAPEPPKAEEDIGTRDTLAISSKSVNEKIAAAVAAAESHSNGTSTEKPEKAEWFDGVDDHRDTGSKPVAMPEREAKEIPIKERTTRVDPVGHKKSSAIPVMLMLAVVLAGAAGYFWWRNAQQQETPTPPVVAKAPPPATPAPAEPPKAAEPTPSPTPTAAEPPKAPEATAKEPEAAKPAGLTVAVSSKPAGAQVTVDTKEQGTTPAKLEGLDPAKVYNVKLTLKGYKEFQTKLKPKAGAEVAAVLVPLPHWVAVKSTPAGADVFVDGKRVGATPTTVKNLDFSKAHKLALKKAGFEPQERDLSADDAWQEKPDHSELAVEVELAKKAAAEPVARKPRKPKAEKPAGETTEKPADTTEKPADTTEKPADTTESKTETKPEKTEDKPVLDKPVLDKPVLDKPVDKTDKPDKTEEKKDENLKTPDWMKK